MEFHDPFESCPYNIFHRIRRSRMQFHVTTCAQNHRHLTGMEQCPFDARHVVKRIEFEHHKSTCPARASVIDYAIHDTASQAKLKILPIDVNPVGRWDEKWDDDPDVKTYDPIQHIKNKPIVYSLIGVSKAKRKNHRLQERIRYKKVIENGGENVSQNRFYSRPKSTSSQFNTSVKVVHEIGDGTDEGEKPLRPPTSFLIAHPTDETFHNYARQTSESSGCMDPEISTSLKYDQSSNHSSSSAAALSSSQRTSFSRKSSDDQWVFEKSARTIDINAVNRNQEVCSIHDKDSNDDNVSSNDDYQFNQHQSKDQEKFSTHDPDNIVSSENNYQFIPDQANGQEKFSTSDTNSVVSSMDNYQFIPYQTKEQENGSISDTDSIVSSKDDYQFHQNQYTVQKRFSISDTISIISGKGKYQFHQHHKDQKKLSITDTVCVASSKDEYQFSRPLVCASSETSLSSSVSETSETDSVYSCEGDEPVIQTLSKTIEETAENNKNNNEFLITDTVYNDSNESQYILTMMNGNSDMSPLSSEEADNFNYSFSNGIEHSSNHSMNSTETNSTDNISIFDKLSKTIEELAMDNKDYKKKSESLDQEINKLKKLPSKNKSRQISATVNLKKGKLFPRCAANFLNLEK